MAGTHENFSRSQEVKASTNRAFGTTFAVVFIIMALFPLLFGEPVRWLLVVASGIVAIITVAVPSWLTVPNRLWLRFGLLLHRIISPVVLAVMFYGVFAPIGALIRASGKDLLRLRRSRSAESYWIKRDPPGPKPESMSNQF